MEGPYSLGIIIPIYNTENYLEECLESIVNQTVPFDEVILVDDGSLDHSMEICEEYCEKYPYFQMISQKNKGAGAARNHGLMYLKSNYFIFLDSDDYLSLQAVEIIKSRINNQDILFYSSEICENIEGVKHSNFYMRNKELCNNMMSGLDFFYQSFPENYIVSPCMAVYKKNFMEKNNIRFPEGLYYEDDYFYMEGIINAKRVECISEKLYVRRYRPGSIMTSDIGRKNCLDKMEIICKIWDYIKENSLIEWREDVLCNYLLSGISEAMKMIEQYEKSEDIKEQEILFIEKFIRYWGKLCENNLTYLYSYSLLLKIYKEMMENNKKYEIKYEEIKILFIKKIKQKLECLCLKDKDIKVGIYGMGNHTKAMLGLYERYIGEIKCKYFYIVSDISQINMDLINENNSIVSYKHIPEDVDLIIISSLSYMNEMIENLKSVDIEPKKIYSLYVPYERFDLVMAEEFIRNESDIL